MYSAGATQYRQVRAESRVATANPHQLIVLLFEGLLSKLAMTKGFMDRRDYEGKSRALGAAVTIIGALQNSLDLEAGEEIAANLDRLYSYMNRRLLTASIENSTEIVGEVVELVRTIKEGWDGIKDEVEQGKVTG